MSTTDYTNLPFAELRNLCKERGLSAGGNTDALIDRLVNHDLGHAPETAPAPDPAVEQKKATLKATDPNPDNPNYDMAGRWIRRPGQQRPDGQHCERRWNE